MGKLLTNTVYLYLLQFANYAFSLITLPLITRVLGPEYYGKIGMGMAFSVYFLLIIDFGFRLSGTKLINDARNNKRELEKIVAEISSAKLMLAFLCAFFLLICTQFIDALKDIETLLYCYLIFSFFSSLIPDYLYRGLENMKIITLRAIIMKGVFTSLIFVFLRNPDQYLFIPLFQTLGEIAALCWIYWDIRHNLGLSLSRPKLRAIFNQIKDSSNYFISRISSTVYSVANTTILGLIFPGASVVGYYTSADRLKSVGTSAMTPIADSFFPYMNRTKDYRQLFKVTAILEIPIIIVCVIIWFYSEEVCVMLFGSEFTSASGLLRWMLPVVAITLPNYMFGFPALSALNETKWANYSVEIAAGNQIIGIIILFYFSHVTAVNLCILTLISEFIILLIRSTVIIKYRKRMKS